MNALVKMFLSTRHGAVAIYAAYVGMLILATCALAIDIGRLGVLRTQLQNAADAAALAGAAQLDGAQGAIARASAVALGAAEQQVTFTLGSTSIEMNPPLFLRSWIPFIPTTTDGLATFIQVELMPKDVNLIFQPFLDLLVTGNGDSITSLQTKSVARSRNIVCAPVPIRACDISQLGPTGESFFTMDPNNAGRQIILRQSTTKLVAVFSMMCPPGQPGCSEAEAIAYADTLDEDNCSAQLGTARPMSAAGIDEAINGRFGDGGAPVPAPNVIHYPDDATLTGVPDIQGAFGEADWDPASYWNDRHGEDLPQELSGASRYQVYLYELGESFARDGDGRKTIYPAGADVPLNYTLVVPPGPQIPMDVDEPENREVDGVPDSGVPVADPRRRLVTVSMIECEEFAPANTFGGQGRFLELFLTRSSNNEMIYTEYVRPLLPQDINPQFVKNAHLVD